MRGNARAYPDKQLSVTAARAQLQMLLCGATDARIGAMTPEGLSATHRINIRECECLLLAERGRRERRAVVQ